MEWYHRMLAVQMKYPMHLVLTLCVGQYLTGLIALAISAFQKVRRHFKELEKGIYRFEVINKGPDGWYVHLHVLVDCLWIDGEALEEYWHSLTGARIKKIRRVGGKKWGRDQGVKDALLEVTKYVVKAPEDLTPEEAYELYVASFGRRMIGTWGLGDSLVHKQETTLHCKICGSRLRNDGRVSRVVFETYYSQFLKCPVEYRAGPRQSN